MHNYVNSILILPNSIHDNNRQWHNFLEHSDYISFKTYSVDHSTSSLPSPSTLSQREVSVMIGVCDVMSRR